MKQSYRVFPVSRRTNKEDQQSLRFTQPSREFENRIAIALAHRRRRRFVLIHRVARPILQNRVSIVLFGKNPCCAPCTRLGTSRLRRVQDAA